MSLLAVIRTIAAVAWLASGFSVLFLRDRIDGMDSPTALVAIATGVLIGYLALLRFDRVVRVLSDIERAEDREATVGCGLMIAVSSVLVVAVLFARNGQGFDMGERIANDWPAVLLGVVWIATGLKVLTVAGPSGRRALWESTADE